MGGKFEVTQWMIRWDGRYGAETVYMGDSLLLAVVQLIHAKRRGSGCATFHWR